MNEMDERYFQIVTRTSPRKKRFFRLLPRTARDPTPAQIEARITFGQLAQKARNHKKTGDLPPGAEEVRAMKGSRSPNRQAPKMRKWEIALEEMSIERFPDDEKERQELRKMRRIITEMLEEEQ